MADRFLRLKLFQTSAAFSLEARAIGVGNRQVVIEGNSLISTLFISQMDVGATVTVNFWEFTTGGQLGERRDIASHKISAAIPTEPEIIVASPFHGNVEIEYIVTGGNVTFSIMLTCVSAFASRIDDNLTDDGGSFDPDENQALPVATYDWTNDTLHFLRGREGKAMTLDPGSTGLLQYQFHLDSGGSIDDLMINDQGEILVNDYGSLLVGG